MKVAVYARVSTRDKDQNPENQLIRLREFVGNHGWEIHKEYVDYASGRTSERPALQALMEDARRRVFERVLVLRIDRFGRSVRNMANMLHDLDSYNVGFMAVDQPGVDTVSSTGRLFLQILGAVAEFEGEIIRERVLDGQERARREGKRIGRPKAGLEAKRGEDRTAITWDDIVDLKETDATVVEILGILHISKSTYYRLRDEYMGKGSGEMTEP